jgi:hypothetical protein
LKWEDAKRQTFVVVIAYIVVKTVCHIKKRQSLRVLENRALRKTLSSEREITREGLRKPQ